MEWIKTWLKMKMTWVKTWLKIKMIWVKKPAENKDDNGLKTG